jgi:parvulin-like peptidyl-prolyl isomerase
MRLAARIQQEKYLAALIDVSVSEEECRGWYEAHKEELAVPQRVHVRHIFIATLEREEEEAKRIIGEALGRLRRGEAEFEDLALAISEDERSRENGGDLGWAHAGRLPGDFAAPVLAMEPREPGLVHTKLGWHLVEVLERKGKEVPAYDAVKPEVAAALEAVKREEGWELYREQLRRMSGDKVEIFHDVLEAGTPGDPGGPDAATGRATPVPPRPRPGSAPTDGPR